MTGATSITSAERYKDVIAWGVAAAPFPNEPESGDRCVVQPAGDGILIAAVDGNGHGSEAAAAPQRSPRPPWQRTPWNRSSTCCCGVTRSSKGRGVR